MVVTKIDILDVIKAIVERILSFLDFIQTILDLIPAISDLAADIITLLFSPFLHVDCHVFEASECHILSIHSTGWPWIVRGGPLPMSSE